MDPAVTLSVAAFDVEKSAVLVAILNTPFTVKFSADVVPVNVSLLVVATLPDLVGRVVTMSPV
jgi:hypothetical protein